MQVEVVENTSSALLTKEAAQTLSAFFLSFESTSTRREYVRSTAEFLRLVATDIGDLSELSRNHLISYQHWLTERGLASKTVLKKLSAISSLCKFLAFEGIVSKDLTYGLKRPRSEAKMETADFSDSEVRKIFESLNPRSQYFTSHRAILAVGFYTGLRSNEIRTLRVKNLGEVKGHRVLNLIVKGGKKHEVPLTPFCFHAICDHLETLSGLGLDTSDPEQILFPCLKPLRNKPLSHNGLRKILNARLKDAGIPISSVRRYSPHSMRATIAGHLLNEKDVPLEQVQKMLAHSSPATTQKYNKRPDNHDKSPVYKVDY